MRQRSALLQLQMALSLVLALTLVLALVRNNIFSKVRVLVLNQPTKNGHETDFYKAKRRIDDMNLHKKNKANPARIVV